MQPVNSYQTLERTTEIPEQTVHNKQVNQLLVEINVSSLPVCNVLPRRVVDLARENSDALAATPTDFGKTLLVINTIRSCDAMPLKH